MLFAGEFIHIYIYKVWYVPKTDAGGRERKKRKNSFNEITWIGRSMECVVLWFDLIQYSFCRASAHKS